MKTRNRLVILASFLPGFLANAGSLVISGLPKRGLAAAKSEDANLVLKDWTAAGSGCRAFMKKAGDVEFQGIRSNATSNSSLLVLKFKLPAYKLSSPPENKATSMTFARECALRLVADPQGKMRIKSVAARTPVVYSKDADVGLKLQFLLRLDGEIVGQALKEVEPGQTIRNADEIVVVNGKPSEEALMMAKMNPKGCGTSQMLGFDYTFIAARKNQPDSALVQLAEEKQLELAVELEKCTN
jgi:hypothetical protein